MDQQNTKLTTSFVKIEASKLNYIRTQCSHYIINCHHWAYPEYITKAKWSLWPLKRSIVKVKNWAYIENPTTEQAIDNLKYLCLDYLSDAIRIYLAVSRAITDNGDAFLSADDCAIVREIDRINFYEADKL